MLFWADLLSEGMDIELHKVILSFQRFSKVRYVLFQRASSETKADSTRTKNYEYVGKVCIKGTTPCDGQTQFLAIKRKIGSAGILCLLFKRGNGYVDRMSSKTTLLIGFLVVRYNSEGQHLVLRITQHARYLGCTSAHNVTSHEKQ